MLKLKLQYFGHLIRRVDSLEKTLMLGGIGGRRRRGRQRMRWLDGITDSMDVESEWTPGVGDGQGGLACCDSWGRKESDTTERLIWSDLIWPSFYFWAQERLQSCQLRQWHIWPFLSLFPSWLHHTAFGILVRWPGIKSVPPAMEVLSLTTGLPGEVLIFPFKSLHLSREEMLRGILVPYPVFIPFAFILIGSEMSLLILWRDGESPPGTPSRKCTALTSPAPG